MIKFHIRGGAKNLKKSFFWHFWAKKSIFGQKFTIILVYFISLHNAVSKNDKFDYIWSFILPIVIE